MMYIVSLCVLALTLTQLRNQPTGGPFDLSHLWTHSIVLVHNDDRKGNFRSILPKIRKPSNLLTYFIFSFGKILVKLCYMTVTIV